MLIVPEKHAVIGDEYVIARRGEGFGWAGQCVASTETYVVMLRGGDGRRVVFFEPRGLDVFAIRALSASEAAVIRVWQQAELPGVALKGGGRLRIGDPTEVLRTLGASLDVDRHTSTTRFKRKSLTAALARQVAEGDRLP